MKYNIWCLLFGHVFILWNWYDRETEQYTKKPIDFCKDCGLSKEELGIK